MNSKVLWGICLVCIAIGSLWIVSHKGRQLVYVGDTQDRVYEMLEQPTITFPEGGSVIQWYSGYEIVLSNNVVTAVKLKPVESKREKQEKDRNMKLAEERLRHSYQSIADAEKISYNTWLERERVRLQKEQGKREDIQAYEKRKSEEKKRLMMQR